MRRHIGHGLCIATALLAFAACSGDDDSSSDDSADATSEVGGSGVSVPGSGATEGSTDSSDAGSSSTTSGSSGTTVGGSAGTTVAGSTGTTVAGSSVTTVGGSSGTTVPGPTTTAVPASTNAVPQTSDDLVLLADGLGPLRFGADSGAVVAAITPVLGEATSDSPAEYPTPLGDGTFQSLDEELGFAHPFGRTVCWPNGLCIEAGGTAAGSYVFVGWYYAATDTDTLAAPNGMDVGSTWADFVDVITVEPGGCYSVGYGSANGITLALQSSGTPFVTIDEDGTETNTTPDPADVRIQQMQAGEQVVYLFGDC